ncbi:MAG: hypothetical protein KIT84_15315 [Labilithrix sp.]|nr:hypothetical protein [Labilithrix sp.]MCW5812394.1 hypothetical protein [Labilithrix sp.]
MRLSFLAKGLAPLLLLAACGGPRDVKAPRGDADVATPLVAAFHEEAGGDQAKAADMYLRALEGAARSPENPTSVSVAMAALDALVHRDVAAFVQSSSSSALVDRVRPDDLARAGGAIDDRLAKIAAGAEGPFVRGLVARARLTIAERKGDAAAADKLRDMTGCARSAQLAGPVAWMNVSAASEPALFDKPGALPAEVPGPGPFIPRVRPMKVSAFGCYLPLYAETPVLGVREVIVDVAVPERGTIGVGLRSSSAAVMRAGGAVVIQRPHALGGRTVPRFAKMDATKGRLRLAVRVGMEQDFENVEIGAWNAKGHPLPVWALKPGDVAASTVSKVTPIEPSPDPRTEPERIAIALGALAGNEPARAESLLAASVAAPSTSPDVLLVYGRAVRAARDLPSVKSQERARSAYERVLETFPQSWEAVLEHAVLAGARRGRAEANIEALTDLDALRAKTKPSVPALLDAFEAQVAGRESLYDRARAAFDRAKGPLATTALIVDTERVTEERTGKDLVAFDCSARVPDRSSLACHRALVAVGDRAGAERELERLRALAGTSQLYLSLSTRSALEAGDLGRATKLLAQMNPGDRALSSLYAAKTKTDDLLRLAPSARDAPSALPGILRDSGDDPIRQFDGVAEKAVNDASLGAALANAATAVLVHRERYDVAPNGLVRFTVFDVRRVMGTTDVESNAQAAGPMLYGRDNVRILRRRIFKKDGRVLLPDPTPRAAQSHADLSQLEAGDAVEAIYEGWGIPNETGNVGIDTPDLLPERTAVHDATIELRYPTAVKSTLWTHPLLGKAEEATEGDRKVLVWKMKDRAVRRLEAGVAKMDRSVGISFSTATWDDVARGLRETIASLESPSPEVSQWAREAARGAAPSRELVDRIVAASGQAVKEANGMVLSDLDLGRGGNHGMTARNILVTHEGSRTWLIVHALRELGVKTDIAVAENDPFSESVSFPPHFGRFLHPLAIAHVPDPKAPGGAVDVWIDADVAGPPLPAGRISPELRGRNALWPDGRIAPLPTIGDEIERDEIDIRLTVDDKGDAKGTITVLLRGNTAQNLAEALVRIVGVERDRALRGVALGWVPFATVEKVELSSTEGSWQVAIRADLTAPAYAQVEGTKPETRAWILPGLDPVHYVFPRPFVTTLSSTYASQAARESALAINRATQYHVRRRVELPAKAQIARVPGPFDAKGPLFSATRKINVTGTSMEEDFTLDVVTGTVPRDKYEAFVTAAHHADDAFRASTRVKPPAP